MKPRLNDNGAVSAAEKKRNISFTNHCLQMSAIICVDTRSCHVRKLSVDLLCFLLSKLRHFFYAPSAHTRKNTPKYRR